MDISTDQINSLLMMIKNLSLTYLPAIVKAVLIAWLGLKVIKRVSNITARALEKANLDVTIRTFAVNLINIALKVFLVLGIAGVFGIPTTSFIALIGAAGLAIGLSLQGSLSNFAGGVLILVLKPYKIGDIVDIQGVKGKVEHIGVFNTTLLTIEKNTVIIPNGPIINHNITNLSLNPLARVDVRVGISYDANIDEARDVLLTTLTNNPYIIAHEPKEVHVEELADNSVNLIVRGFTRDGNYFNAFYSLTEGVKKDLDTAGIDIPYPQRVIHTLAPEKVTENH